MAFRFLHTGDLHLDSPFVGVTALAPSGVRDQTERRIEPVPVRDVAPVRGSP
jgi:hypothetical protein